MQEHFVWKSIARDLFVLVVLKNFSDWINMANACVTAAVFDNSDKFRKAKGMLVKFLIVYIKRPADNLKMFIALWT